MFFKRNAFGGRGGPIDFVIAGLGNPGPRYRDTRHNVGFMVLDELAARHRIRLDRVRFGAKTGEGRIAGKRVFLMQPQSYMNLSGGPVMSALRHYRMGAENLVVVVDDTALPPGRLRVRASGSAGGHNGLKSIIASAGDGFPRVRVGIGQPVHHEMVDWVTSKFTAAERPVIAAAVKLAADAVERLVADGVEAAAGAFNGKAAT